MAKIEMVMPKMGESIMEGTILKWLKKVGDSIKQDEPVLEVATDKVDTEVPSLYAGVLKEILLPEGTVAAIGAVIAIIETEASVENTLVESKVETPEIANVTIEPKQETPVTQTVVANNAQDYTALPQFENRFYSPLVLNIARNEQIGMAELNTIPGTGKDDRVTKNDILAYLEAKKSGKINVPQVTKVEETPKVEKPVEVPSFAKQEVLIKPVQEDFAKSVKPATSLSGAVEIIEMDRMRKIIAQRMIESKATSAHVTSFVEADVTNLVFWRNRIKQEFLKREGDAITLTPIFIEALAKVLKDYPLLNSSIEGDKIIVKKDINIGLAVALPNGNLIVPVIKNADQLNLVGITKKVNELARKARENKLTADDVSDGTYTMSNVGSFGNVMGTPIILQPQIAIMAFGAVQKKPAVVETEFGDAIGIRHLMYLSHSYDHRIVDGSLGGTFVRKVADYLEKFDLNRKLW
ncbi:MAG: dihydrolipoamide acetyltransferase [Bacteroidota bacterium]|jgi:2-oxoglutarate dehydrogenase E2 component (dihydrolipoamide succinyltransferase)